MSLKSVVFVFILCTTCITASKYEYNFLAGGWLKYHEKAIWEEADIICDTEGAVLASPVNSQIRDGIKEYLMTNFNSGATLHTGVQAQFETGDFYSIEGVELNKMPVIIETGSVNYTSSDICVKWRIGQDEVMSHTCKEQLPFVCFKKRKNLDIAGCGTTDTEYKYEERTGKCYKMHTQSLPWTKAYNKCKKESANLAVSNGKMEKKVLTEMYEKYPTSVITNAGIDCAFMGFRKWNANETWTTVNDQTLEESGFTGWSTHEPNNIGGIELCGCMYRDGTFNDRRCDIPLPYICEKNPVILYTSKNKFQ